MKLDLGAEHTIYTTKDGTRVPGVTTVLGELAKPHLMKWYANEERAGVVETMAALASMHQLDVTMLVRALPQKPFAEAKRDRAADIGTVTHALVEGWLTGDALESDGIDQMTWHMAQHGYDRFRRWWDNEGFTLLHSELVMVSELQQVGGTADIIARDRDGRMTLIDLKTSKASPYWPYRETFGQVAAYAAIWTEQDHADVKDDIDRIVLNRIGKTAGDNGQVYEVSAEQRTGGMDLFLAALWARRATRTLNCA